MARYALIKRDNTVDRMATNVDPTVQTKDGWRWLACEPVAQPSYDPTAETVEGPVYNVGVSSVTEGWTKRNLTSQELSDRKDNAVAQLNGGLDPLAKVLLNHENRIRALESKTPVTMAQFKAGVKALL